MGDKAYWKHSCAFKMAVLFTEVRNRAAEKNGPAKLEKEIKVPVLPS